MLTGKQKRYLRSLAHNIDPIFQIGKAGINDNMISQIDETLENRELIKMCNVGCAHYFPWNSCSLDICKKR